MFVEIGQFLFYVGIDVVYNTNKIIGFNVMDITFNFSVLDFESTVA